LDARILVVDDASPDGTAAVAEALGVGVLRRDRKAGLGPAYVAGFDHALAHGAEFVFEMDADLSHDPADLPRLLAAARDGADLVLGSRYVAGGGVGEWGAVRRAISRGGSAYARRVLRVGIRDLTGGFKVWRRPAVEAIDLDSIPSLGYAFQVETTYRAIRAGLRVIEVPILFTDRRVGESKMTGRIVLEAAMRVPMMRFRNN
jgi:dolichol-phosphate mannosyltransferase